MPAYTRRVNAQAAPRTREQVLDAVERVAVAVREASAEAERDSRFPAHVLDGLVEQRLFRLWLPVSLGGDELALPDALHVFESAARIDGSFGFLVTIGVGGGLFAARLEEPAAREIFGPPTAVIAGSGAPNGTAAPVEGGYRVSGRWAYASGAHHATWFTANCKVSGPATGKPVIRAMAFPAARVRILDTWHVSGMRATDSHDFEVEDQFVPLQHSFDVFGEPREVGPLYRVPFGGIAECSFAAVALGIAGNALEAFERETVGRLEREQVRFVLGEARTSLDGARVLFHGRAARLWDAVTDGQPVGEQEQVDVRRASVHAAATAVRVVEDVYLLAGMTPLFLSSELGRCWRDVHAIAQHVSLSRGGYGATGASRGD